MTFMKSSPYVVAGLVAAAMMTYSVSSWAGPEPVGDAKAGHALIQKWCSQCHLSDGARTASDMAPPFGGLMMDPKYTDERLRTWLSDPHPPMPKIGLTRRMIRDIIAHLSTLRPKSQ
ncbi:MAG: cytochrome c [Rhodospirillaceae bacterium]|jgi:cytochrome c|nr:cytochrome c [Rhodospirillaceae bacterium]